MPGPVRRDALQTPDVDLWRARPEPTIARADRAPARPITADTPADVRARVQAGASIAEVAREYGAPWLTVRRWANGARI